MVAEWMLEAAEAALTSLGVKTAARRRSPRILQLLKAKHESDHGHYKAKHDIMRKLIAAHPHEFRIDSERRGIVGVEHTPSHFRMHLPRRVLPKKLAGLK